MGVKHAFKSLKADPADATIIGATKWNDDHYCLTSAGAAQGNQGDLLYRGTSGIVSLLAGAAGILTSTGAGFVPTWSATPNITSLTIQNSGATELYFSGAGTTNIASDGSISILAGGTLSFGAGGATLMQLAQPGGLTFNTDNTYDIGANGATRPRTLYVGTSVLIGTNLPTSGAIRLQNNTAIMSRNGANSANAALLQVTSADMMLAGDAFIHTTVNGYTLRLHTESLGTPGTLANGDWWVECAGTSPARIAALKFRDGGTTRTIAQVTY